MPYDPKWDFETETDPKKKGHPLLTARAFVNWLETKPKDGTYNWWDVGSCLLCVYLRETFGMEKPSAATWNGVDGFGQATLSGNWSYKEICSPQPHTFGAALERARAYGAE